MGIGNDRGVCRQLRTVFHVGAVRELTDGQLLERFATEPADVAELAFSELVERHGPMVMRVCRGVLSDPHAAQDAFQATFLVLVKRARGLWVRDSIGPWLHQVAYRTAVCARTTAARHRRLERRAAIPADQAVRPEQDRELERLLHEELDRLPDRLRSPIVLCDLEGRTHEQAARHLGWPVGTVKSRLSRGRARLRDRLIRRGVASELGPLAVAGALKAPVLTISPVLLDATATTALRFAAIGRAVRGPAVILAEGVLRTMSISQWWKVATVLVAAGATASGVEWAGAGGGPGPQAARQEADEKAGDAPTHTVKPGRMDLVVSARGNLEPGRSVDVYCNVEGGTAIIKIVPEGTAVKKGDVLVELDSAALKDRLINQRITVKAAEANYLNAKLAREVAEIALQEYTEIFKQDLDALERRIYGSKNAIGKLEARLERDRKAGRDIAGIMPRPSLRTPADILAEVEIQDRIEDIELRRDRERRELDQAESRKRILKEYTYGKNIKELKSEVEKAHSDELARQATWELEQAKEKKLETQIANCTLIAPIDGMVVYARHPVQVGPTAIEEGATVRERQKVIQIIRRDGPIQANVKIHESVIGEIKPKMKARVKVDAFPDRTFEGTVVEVYPLPDAGNFFNQSVKVYTTRIRIEGAHPHLRPGMTAEGEILLGEREDILGVPLSALIFWEGKQHLAVKTPDGRVEWREVVVGAHEGSMREVKQGLQAGDRVILSPGKFLSDEQRARVKESQEAWRWQAEQAKKAGRAQ